MEFTASLDHLFEMLTFVREEGKRQGVDEALAKKMELACEEALVNIISYAFASHKGTIEMICARHNQRFEVIIRDSGKPFNPIESEIDPQLDLPPEERQIGGLGIYLIRSIIDESSYQRIENENILRLTLRLDS